MAVLGTLLMAGWALFVSHQVWAFPSLARQTKAACAACHVNVAGGPELAAAGKAFQADPKAAVTADVKANEYAGSKKCMMCHSKQHKAWQETDHAKAWKALEKSDEKATAAMAESLGVPATHPATKSDACIQCHVVGFKLPGGYPAADSTKNASLQLVGCEACHGPGAKHAAAPMADKKKTIARGSEKMCLQCHTPKVSPEFKFEEFKKKVHPVAAAAKTSG
jgi:hypothetical protein